MQRKALSIKTIISLVRLWGEHPQRIPFVFYVLH